MSSPSIAAIVAGLFSILSVIVAARINGRVSRIEVNVDGRLGEALTEIGLLRLQVEHLGGVPSESAPPFADTVTEVEPGDA